MLDPLEDDSPHFSVESSRSSYGDFTDFRLEEDGLASFEHGIRANSSQVAIHLAIAFLIGVSLRLVIFPEALLADDEKPSKTDFLIFFGISKAVSNSAGGVLADRWDRRRAALCGWCLGLAVVPVQLAGIMLSSRFVLDIADVLLGAMQGMTWGVNIICLMDLLGPDGRGLASALSNSIGYSGSAIMAPVAAYLVKLSGDAHLCNIGLGVSMTSGLLLSAISFDTSPWVESKQSNRCGSPCRSADMTFFRSPTNGLKGLSSASPTSAVRPEAFTTGVKSGCGNTSQVMCSLGGLTVNAATATVWGPALLWLKSGGHLGVESLGFLEGFFTATKVLCMMVAGCLTYYAKPQKIAACGLGVLSVGLFCLWATASGDRLSEWGLWGSTALIGIGVGGAYPVLAASVTAGVPDRSRASVYGAYRMWRDFGYAAGGLVARFSCDLGCDFVFESAVMSCWSMMVAAVFTICLVFCPSLQSRKGVEHGHPDGSSSRSLLQLAQRSGPVEVM